MTVLLFCYCALRRRSIDSEFLLTALAGKVMRSVVSVIPFVFTVDFGPSDLLPRFLLAYGS